MNRERERERERETSWKRVMKRGEREKVGGKRERERKEWWRGE